MQDFFSSFSWSDSVNMQDTHWKLTKKTLKPPTAGQRFRLRHRSVQVVDAFLRPRTASLSHTVPTKSCTTLVSRQGSTPCLIDYHVSRMAREPQDTSESAAVATANSEGESRLNRIKFTINRSPIHSYSLAEVSDVYNLRCKSVQQARLSAELSDSSTSALLVSMQTHLDSRLSSLKEEKVKVRLVAFEPWGVNPAAIQAFAALKRGDSAAVKALVGADRSLVRAVDAVSAT